MAYRTKLQGTGASFGAMMENGFGVITVMNADIYDTSALLKDDSNYFSNTAKDIVTNLGSAKRLCRLETLKIANVTQEGPTKTVTGGQYSNPLIKFGKSARLEMQDALGNAKAIDALCGGIREWNDELNEEVDTIALHFGEDFSGPRTIVGDSFFIDRQTGQQVPVKIIFYQFLPDSIFNLTQDAEGDATVFDMNGDLLTTVIKVGDSNGESIPHGVFYSIVGAEDTLTFSVNPSTLEVTGIKTDDGDQAYYSANGGLDWDTTTPTTVATGDTVLVKVENAGRIIWSTSVIKKA